MDVKTWRSRSIHHHAIAPLARSFSEHRNYDLFVTTETVKSRSKMQNFLRGLRRKLRKEKNKVFSCTAPPPPRQDPYDPYTYSQNFDDEEARWEEPDNLSRSFSARFADSSMRMVKKVGF